MLAHARRIRREAALASLAALVPAEAGVDVSAEVVEGDPASEVARVATELDADLIVVEHGSSCTSWSWTAVPLAEVLLHRAPCPVLQVPA
jgi:nucleotide-binding universal stress UspA family protein